LKYFFNDLCNNSRISLGKIGVPRRLTEGWNMWPCVALTMEVHELYEQTPGPGAGEPLR